MFNLMPKHNGKLVFAVHIGQDSRPDEDVSARKRNGTIKARIWIVVEPIG